MRSQPAGRLGEQVQRGDFEEFDLAKVDDHFGGRTAESLGQRVAQPGNRYEVKIATDDEGPASGVVGASHGELWGCQP